MLFLSSLLLCSLYKNKCVSMCTGDVVIYFDVKYISNVYYYCDRFVIKIYVHIGIYTKGFVLGNHMEMYT